MLLLTLMSFGGIIVSGSMWMFGQLDQENKSLFVELFDDNKI